MRNGCRKTLRGRREKGETMVADFTRPISERAQPDAYKLAARRESLYILIAADDTLTRSSFSLVFPSLCQFSPLSPISFRLSVFSLHSKYISTHSQLLIGRSRLEYLIFRIEDKEKICHFKEEFFSPIYFFNYFCFNYHLNNHFTDS